jgi:hypothetical protein
VITHNPREIGRVQAAAGVGKHKKIIRGHDPRDCRLLTDDEFGESLVGAHHSPITSGNVSFHIISVDVFAASARDSTTIRRAPRKTLFICFTCQ